MKYVFDTWMSNGTAATMTPERPPMTNVKMKPTANSIAVFIWITPRHIVPSQEKILMPVGTAMSIVEIIIGTRSHDSMPDTNMWWAHTEKPRTAMPTVENATAR